MADRAAKEGLFDRLADVAKALGNGRRAELIDVLAQGERSVEVLASEIGQTTANTSHHLQVLAHAGLVTTRRDGNRIYYRLTSERVAEFWSALRDVASRHVAGISDYIDAYLGPRDSIATITREELASELESGKLVVLDGSEGVPAQRLEEGFPEWRRAGLPVEIGTPATPVTA